MKTLDHKLLQDIANKYQTPCYVYDKQIIIVNYNAYATGLLKLNAEICYAVKANSNLSILKLLCELGSGFDVVSIGELQRCLAVGAKPEKIVFSGVGKTKDEIAFAINAGIGSLNVESEPELKLIAAIAQELNSVAKIAIRINPDVDAKTHPYIATGMLEHKFGSDLLTAEKMYHYANTNEYLQPIGVDCHIGSQITTLDPFTKAINQILAFSNKLKQAGIAIEHINLGGGLGVSYEGEKVVGIQSYCNEITKSFNNTNYKVFLEPGRSLVANCGVLLTEVLYLKNTTTKNFAIVDAAMNDLLRPSLYAAHHNIYPLNQDESLVLASYDVVGPVCETGDFFAKDRALKIKTGDVLAIEMAGAYGFTMSSNYNSRPKVAEILLEDNEHRLIRKRESLQDLINLEQECLEN